MPSPSNRKIFLYIFPVISGILSGIALLYLVHWLAWIMLVPLIFSVLKNKERAFLYGFISGSIQGLIVLSWMINSVDRYSGTDTHFGFLFWLITSLYYALIISLQIWLVAQVYKQMPSKKHTWLLNAIAAASIWIIIDWVRIRLSPGIPWAHYQYYVTQIKWEIPVQLTAFTGAVGLTFVILFVNILITHSLIKRDYLRLFFPASVVVILLISGFLRFEFNPSKQIAYKAALLCENTDARQRWSSDNGDTLATTYFHLNYLATKEKPQLIVWSETAIPWNLAMDDNLITKCLEITWPSRAGHIIGIFSPSEKNSEKRYNSAYYLQPDGAITNRYDKMQLLTFLEQPVGSKKIPFFNTHARTDIEPGNKRNLLKTPIGLAGILICNESVSPRPFKETVRMGAEFLVVMSNDAWFEGTQLVKHHFYMNRLRAVESGLDMIVNSNRGISGIINYKGKILESDNSKTPVLVSGNISKRSGKSFYAEKGDYLIILSLIYMIFIGITIITTKSKKT